MGLTQKILVFTGVLIVILVAGTVAFTTVQANRLAHAEIDRGLSETKGVWETFQTDRYSKLKLGLRVLANDPAFKAMVVDTDPGTVHDTLRERGQDLAADFFICTDESGVVIARSDRPTGTGGDLSQDPLVRKPLDDGEESATVWRQGEKLYHAVSAPMQTGPEIIGVLIAGYGIDEVLANNIQKITHSKVAYLTRAPGQPALLSVSTLGTRENALRDALSRPELSSPDSPSFDIDLDGDRHVGFQVPLRNASGTIVGSVIALRSVAEEMSSFVRFRTSLVIVGVVVMLMGLVAAYFVASRITGPVRRLVDLVERARDGSYSGAVAVNTRDEIGTLARTFNSLLADLREKEQLIGFLREGMTGMVKKGPGLSDSAATATLQTGSSLGTAARTSINLERGAVFANRYEVRETLGKGGMGVVYRAYDRTLDEDVAVKLLRPDVIKDDPSLLARFKDETKLARRITHRNVLRTHDLGETDGIPYISMEYLEGVTLKDLVRQKGALPLGVGLRIAKQMCAGLEAAHAEGVVHRDIKPQNMLIMPETGDLKIMDFGIARRQEVKGADSKGGMTSTGVVMGTPDYMPPEQAEGHAADFRSDIYSLGIVFYEIFTGRLPFIGDSVMMVVLAHMQQPPAAPRSVNPRIPPHLETVILRCIEKEPARRYESVEAILEDLTTVSSQADAA